MNAARIRAFALVLLACITALVVAPVTRAQLIGGVPGIDVPVQPASAPTRVISPTLLDTEFESDASSLNPLAIIGRAGRAVQSGGASSGPTADDPAGLSAGINILVVLTVVSLVPSIMLMCTCFVRIVIVLGLLKQALGTQTLPPPQVIIGLALFMTLLVMAPTLDRINTEAIAPYRAGEIRSYDELWSKARQPVRDFMFDQIESTNNWSSVYMILDYRGVDCSEPSRLSTNDVDMITLVPAFMLSELKTGFLIGFKVYLPFLVIDMVISSLLISMGMMMLPPVLISLPFKLLLFVLVDGWTLVVGSLMQSFAQRPPGAKTALLHTATPLFAPLLEHTSTLVAHTTHALTTLTG
jgi:flagellar biosynthetic protein FliP